MKKSFSTRRVARKIGQEDDDAASASPGPSGIDSTPESIVKRPHLSTKPKKKSSLRLSFGPGEHDAGADASADDDGNSAIFTPKKSKLSRIALENAERKSLRPSSSTDNLVLRPGVSGDRPSYSKDYLQELKQSTPSTPKTVGQGMELDISSKFGPLAKLGYDDNSVIPSEAEIREKKERRARMAKAPDFLSLDGDESDQERRGEVFLRPKEKYAETRLVPEDEDVAEGFEDFVEDGKISLGRKAEREQARKKRLEMEEMILEAEGVDSDQASDDSEAERKEVFEASQTRAGTYGQSGGLHTDSQRPKTPPRIAPVPELSAVLLKMRNGLQEMEQSRAAKLQQLEQLRAEKKDIAEREVWIQLQLKETGERYEKLRMEAENAVTNGADGTRQGERPAEPRGLETLGTTPMLTLSDAQSD